MDINNEKTCKIMPNICIFRFWRSLPLPRKPHKHLNTQVKEPQHEALRSIAPGGGMPTEPGAAVTASPQAAAPRVLSLSLSMTKSLVSQGTAMPALPTQRQRSGAADPSEAGRNVLEQTICKTWFTGIFPIDLIIRSPFALYVSVLA